MKHAHSLIAISLFAFIAGGCATSPDDPNANAKQKAMIGAAVILFDPIFQGLAISLLFGLASSTLLTVLVIPAIYIVMRDDERPLDAPPIAETRHLPNLKAAE